MQDLRLFYPGALSWLAQATEQAGFLGPVTYDSEGSFEWCEAESLKLPVRVNFRRSLRDGEQAIEAPVFVRLFLRFGETTTASDLEDFARQLAVALAKNAHTPAQLGTMSYDGGTISLFGLNKR